MKNYPPSIFDYIDFEQRGGIFFFHSPERYVLKCVKSELAALAAKGVYEVAFFDCSEDKKALLDAVGAAGEITLFAKKRIIVAEIGEKLDEKEQAVLENYISFPDSANFLIVLASEMDKKTKFFKSLQKMTKIYFPVPLPTQLELKNFVKSEFAPLIPDEKLTAFFLNGANQDMFFIHNEISKLKLYCEANVITQPTYDNAATILNDLSEQVIFKIMNLLTLGKRADALALYHEILVFETEQAINSLLISMFFKHFKAIMQIRILRHEGKNSEISSYLTKNGLFYLKNSTSVAEKYKNSTVKEALKLLAEIELGMKGAENAKRTETRVELESFIAGFFL